MSATQPPADAVDHEYDDFDRDQCWQCHGEGFVYDCFEEWACVDPEGGCDLCMSRCDLCRPRAIAAIEQRDHEQKGPSRGEVGGSPGG